MSITMRFKSIYQLLVAITMVVGASGASHAGTVYANEWRYQYYTTATTGTSPAGTVTYSVNAYLFTGYVRYVSGNTGPNGPNIEVYNHIYTGGSANGQYTNERTDVSYWHWIGPVIIGNTGPPTNQSIFALMPQYQLRLKYPTNSQPFCIEREKAWISRSMPTHTPITSHPSSCDGPDRKP